MLAFFVYRFFKYFHELRNKIIKNGGRQEATDHGSRGPEAQEGLGRDERHQPRPVQEGGSGAKTYSCTFLGFLGQSSKIL